MKKIFWNNLWQKTLTTKITFVVDDDKVLLDEIITFSFSGGQESDHGTMHGFSILSSESQDLSFGLVEGSNKNFDFS